MVGRVPKVIDPAKVVTDELVLRRLVEQGIDKDYVEFYQDYAPRSLGKEHSPYAKFYRDLKSRKRFMVVSGLPMVKPNGVKIRVGWTKQGNRYTSKANLFSATVNGRQVQLTCLSDQPNGTKAGDRVTYSPQLFLNGIEVQPISDQPDWLEIDPINPNYHQNVLEWDYGICKRRLRIVEGSIFGSWVFSSNPNGEVRIKYNQSGDYKLRLGQFKTNEDEEIIHRDVFDNPTTYGFVLSYPLIIGDSATFYPDAVPSTSVDGQAGRFIASGASEDWATIRGGAGTTAYENNANVSYVNYQSGGNGRPNTWMTIQRAIALFDVSGLPDGCTVSATTLSLYGTSKGVENTGNTPDMNVYSSNPITNTNVVAGDYAIARFGSTAYSTAITYANWLVANPFWNDFVFNATGIAAVQAASDGNTVVKLGIRNANYDVANSVPPTCRLPVKNDWVNGYASEQGNGYKPKLVVTYGVGVDHEKSLSDSVAIADTVTTKAVGLIKADSSAIVDSFSKVSEFKRALANNVVIADTYSKVVGIFKVDAVGISDVLVTEIGIHIIEKVVGDSFAITDAISKSVSIPEADSIAITDSLAKVFDQVQSDLLAIADSIAKESSIVKSDSLAIADALLKNMDLGRVDTMAIIEALTTIEFFKAIGDNVPVEDAISKVLSISKADTMAIVESTYRVRTKGVKIWPHRPMSYRGLIRKAPTGGKSTIRNRRAD